jgi:hypothetical protein
MNTRFQFWDKHFDIARHLVKVIETSDLKTPGQWVDWLHRVRRLPRNCQLWVWRKVNECFPAETVRYLQSWR